MAHAASTLCLVAWVCCTSASEGASHEDLSHEDYTDGLHENLHKEPLVDYSDGSSEVGSRQEEHLETFLTQLQKHAHKQWNDDYCELKSYRDKNHAKLPADMDKELVMMVSRFIAKTSIHIYAFIDLPITLCTLLQALLFVWQEGRHFMPERVDGLCASRLVRILMSKSVHSTAYQPISSREHDHCQEKCYKDRYGEVVKQKMTTKETIIHYYQWGKTKGLKCACGWFEAIVKKWYDDHCDHSCHRKRESHSVIIYHLFLQPLRRMC
jgi:hypothetical protein